VGVALSLYSSARLRFIIHQDVSPMRLFLFPLFFFFFFDRNLLFLFLISTWYFLFAPFSFLFFSLADFFLIHLLTAHIQRREDFITARSSAPTPTIRPPTPPPSLYEGSNSKHSAPLFFTCSKDKKKRRNQDVVVDQGPGEMLCDSLGKHKENIQAQDRQERIWLFGILCAF
jgi:hypothetical protein